MNHLLSSTSSIFKDFFEDPNTSTHGNRYQQPPVTTNSDGFVRFQLQFTDAPASSPNTDYTTVLKAGDAYFAWDVSIRDLGIEAPKVESICLLQVRLRISR